MHDRYYMAKENFNDAVKVISGWLVVCLPMCLCVVISLFYMGRYFSSPKVEFEFYWNAYGKYVCIEVCPFLANLPIIYPLKTENQVFSGDIKWEHWPEWS